MMVVGFNGSQDVFPEPRKSIGDIFHLLLQVIGGSGACPGDPVEDIAGEDHIGGDTEFNPGHFPPLTQGIHPFEDRILRPLMHGWIFRWGLFTRIDGLHELLGIAIRQGVRLNW